MAYISQDDKKAKAPAIKAILKKYGLTGSLSINHYSTLVLTIRSGKIDFEKNFKDNTGLEYFNNQVNTYHIEKSYSGDARNALTELYNTMMEGNHNNSDIQTDYFDVGWYISIDIGKWDKPYVLEK